MSSIFKRKVDIDSFDYCIPHQAIRDTERILSEFSFKRHPCEELVYWAGVREGNKSIVRLVVAPRANTDFGRVEVSHDANFEFIKALSAKKYVQIAQVHTHPSSWVGHSLGDSRYAAFKINGLLSIVVPVYGKKGMLPLDKRCGVHRFDESEFVRLPRKYVATRFHVLENEKSEIKDLRR